MTEFQSRLIPFDSHQQLPIDITCFGKLIGQSTLDIKFILSGNINDILIDPPVENSQRTDKLWEKTCFEIFIKSDESSSYWEYNLSPSSNWAIYGFSAYRQGKFDELSIDTIPIRASKEHKQLSLASQIPLPKSLFEQNLKIGLSSVVQDDKGDIYYYALTHVKSQPDFHADESFIVTVMRK